jgi:hypothetical protein
MLHPLSAAHLATLNVIADFLPPLSIFFAIAAVSAFIVVTAVASAGLQAQISKTRAYVETLASPRLEGRLAGSNGERLAGEYIVAELQKIGAKPLPGQQDFRLPFEFTAGTKDGGSTLSLRFDAKTGTEGGVAFVGNLARALSFSDNGDVEGPVVFAGYGIVVPDSQGFAYDSYATLDVKDKIVVVLRYFPEDAEPKTKGILSRYADLRYKAMAARQHGAKAMIVVTGPNSPNAGELAPMTFDTAIAPRFQPLKLHQRSHLGVGVRYGHQQRMKMVVPSHSHPAFDCGSIAFVRSSSTAMI